MSFASQFAAGASIAKGLLDTYRDSKMRGEMDEVANAKAVQSQGFTTEDDLQMDAMSKALKPDGTPYYNVQDDGKGGRQVQSNFDHAGQDGETIVAGALTGLGPKPITDFLGKRTAGHMTDDQVTSARTQAMAGIIGKYNPVEGMRMAAEAKRGERDDQRFALEKSRGERDERSAVEAEADKAYGKQLDAEVGDAFKARLANPDGSTRAATVDDYLAASQLRAGKLTEAGKIEKAGEVFKDYQAQAFSKIKLQDAQRTEALGKTASALASGDLSAVKDFYNEFIPDGAKVTDVSRGGNGQIVIKRESLDGKPMPDAVMKDTGQLVAGLAAFKDPMAVYNWSQNEFKNNLALRADSRADKSLALQGAGIAESRANRDFTRSEAEKKAAANMALYKDQHPNATPAQLEAAYRGILSGAPDAGKNAPSEVKLAQAMVAAGLAPDMKSGLEMAVTRKSQSPSETHKDFVQAGLKNFDSPEAAVKKADQVMATMGYAKTDGRWTDKKPAAPAAAAKPKSEADAHAQAQAAVGRGASKDAINGRLKEMGFAPLP